MPSSTKEYRLPKCGHPRSWKEKQRRSPRDYWLQLCVNGEMTNRFKNATWVGVCNYASAWISTELRSHSELDDVSVLLIDGRVPEDQLNAAPIDSIWNRWERYPFTDEYGEDAIATRLKMNGLIEILEQTYDGF